MFVMLSWTKWNAWLRWTLGGRKGGRWACSASLSSWSLRSPRTIHIHQAHQIQLKRYLTWCRNSFLCEPRHSPPPSLHKNLQEEVSYYQRLQRYLVYTLFLILPPMITKGALFICISPHKSSFTNLILQTPVSLSHREVLYIIMILKSSPLPSHNWGSGIVLRATLTSCRPGCNKWQLWKFMVLIYTDRAQRPWDEKIHAQVEEPYFLVPKLMFLSHYDADMCAAKSV